MSVIAIPNVSEGRSRERIELLSKSVCTPGVKLLDVHSDPFHGRSVLTVGGGAADMIEAMVSLARETSDTIDLRTHDGVHPRTGALDVCPLVPEAVDMDEATKSAQELGRRIAAETGIPVYLYGEAALRPGARELADIRRGGLGALTARALAGFPPDFGSSQIDPRVGAVCVGARGDLIAFNVWMRGPLDKAKAVAAEVRSRASGLSGVRALGLPLAAGVVQVSMNLTDPDNAGIDDVFPVVLVRAARHGVEILATEIIGLVRERFLPNPDAQAARLLLKPGRSLEAALA